MAGKPAGGYVELQKKNIYDKDKELMHWLVSRLVDTWSYERKKISETQESENYKLRINKISVAYPGCLSRIP